MDWLWIAIRAAIMFACGFVAWFVHLSIRRNVRKYPEKAEEENKARMRHKKRLLTVEELRPVIAKENALASLLFGVILAGVSTLLYVGLAMIFK